MPQLMPLPLTVSCFSKIQIGFTFLVPAHLGRPGKGPLNGCVGVGVLRNHTYLCGFVCGMADRGGRKFEEPRRISGNKVATLRTPSDRKPSLMVVCTCNNIDMDRLVVTTSAWLLTS